MPYGHSSPRRIQGIALERVFKNKGLSTSSEPLKRGCFNVLNKGFKK